MKKILIAAIAAVCCFCSCLMESQEDAIYELSVRFENSTVSSKIDPDCNALIKEFTNAVGALNTNNKINWIPESIGKGRFGDWLENVQDWGISRNRYWGTPLNIWECECGHQESIGSRAELKEKSKNCPADIELHRPYVDMVEIPCPD